MTSALTADYHLFPRIPLRIRLLLAGVLLLAGFAVQIVTLELPAGAALLLAGNLLLLMRGVTNVQAGEVRFSPEDWTPIDDEAIDEIIARDRRMIRWDLNPWELSNLIGAFVLAVIGAALVLYYRVFAEAERELATIVLADAAVLLLPHWLTGMRRTQRRQAFVGKAEICRRLIVDNAEALAACSVTLLAQFAAGDPPLPKDLKFKVLPSKPPEGFLGLYGQVSMNEVNGRAYPYFYCVLVGKKGSGIRALSRSGLHDGLRFEKSTPRDVEVLVVRQETTKTSGYHTDRRAAQGIFAEGLRLMRRLAS